MTVFKLLRFCAFLAEYSSLPFALWAIGSSTHDHIRLLILVISSTVYIGRNAIIACSLPIMN